MKGITSLEPRAEVFPRLRLGRRSIDGGPFGRKLRSLFKAPVRVRLRHVLANPVAADILEQPAPNHFADFALVVGNEVFRDPPDDFGNSILPLLVRFRHFNLAARQADDGRGASCAGSRHSQVLNERMKRIGHCAMTVEVVQNFVEENQHHTAGRLKKFAERFGPRRRCFRRRAQASNSRVSGNLSRDIDPRGFFAVLRVPGVSDEDTDFCLWHFGNARFPDHVPDTGIRARLFAIFSKVIEAGESVSFAAAKLRDERQDRRGAFGLARQSLEHHPRVLFERSREACA